MPQVVNVDGVGRIHFPDNMTPEQIDKVLREEFTPKPQAPLPEGITHTEPGSLKTTDTLRAGEKPTLAKKFREAVFGRPDQPSLITRLSVAPHQLPISGLGEREPAPTSVVGQIFEGSVPRVSPETFGADPSNKIAQAGAGIVNLGGGLVDFIRTPLGMATAGLGGIAPQAVKATMVPVGAAGLTESFPGMREAWAKGDIQGAVEQGGSTLFNLGMVGAPLIKVKSNESPQAAASRAVDDVLRGIELNKKMPLSALEMRKLDGLSSERLTPSPSSAPIPSIREIPVTNPLAKTIKLDPSAARKAAARSIMEPKVELPKVVETLPQPEPSIVEPVVPTPEPPKLSVIPERPTTEQLLQQKLSTSQQLGAPKVGEQTQAELLAKPFGQQVGDARSQAALKRWSDTTFGITLDPRAAEMAGVLADYFRREPPNPNPPLVEIAGVGQSRLQPYAVEKLIANDPQGLGRVPIIGRFFDPRYSANTEFKKSINTRAYSAFKAKNFASEWAQSQKFDPFVAAEDGTIGLANGQRGYMSDVIEAEMRQPGSQPISPEQRNWIHNEWTPLRDRIVKMLREENATKILLEDGTALDVNDAFFHRPAIGKRGVPTPPPSGGGGPIKPGTKPAYEYERGFLTEKQGATAKEEAIIYDPSAISRVTKYIESAHRAVADTRLANDPALGAIKLSDTLKALKAKHKAKRDTLTKEEKIEFDAQLKEESSNQHWLHAKQVHVAPAFQGKIFPNEVAAALERAYGQSSRDWVKKAEKATGLSKAVQATIDASAPLVQGFALLGRHPVRWTRATVNMFKSFRNPETMRELMQQPKYQRIASEFTQAGGSLFRLFDFMEGAAKGATATKIPVLGLAVKASGRMFGVFFDVAKMELWDAYSKTTPKQQWARLAESIDNALFIGRMEEIGLNPTRTLGERLLAFAPSYLRGGAGLVSSVVARDVSGRIARNMLAGYATASMAIAAAAYTLLDLSDEEWKERFDPLGSKFMKIPVEVGGKKLELGLGNVLTSFIRLLGSAYKFHDKDSPLSQGGVVDNPYLRYLRSRSAFLPGLATDIITGKDYFDNPINPAEATVRRFVPFFLQDLFPREPEQWSQRLGGAAFTFIGINSYPESKQSEWMGAANRLAGERFQKSYGELDLGKRAEVINTLDKDPNVSTDPDTLTPDQQQKIATRAFEKNMERQASLAKRLSQPNQRKLAELSIQLPAYKGKLTAKNQEITLLPSEQDRYEVLLAQEYDKLVDQIDTKMFKANPEQAEDYLNKWFRKAKEDANNRMFAEMNER